MELIERAEFLAILQTKFENVAEGEGHCMLISGEAGIGKTSLVRAFCKERKNDCRIFQGTCDALFTPRPLAPLFDIASQIRTGLIENNDDIADRTLFFSRLFHELGSEKQTTLIVFEDIHWADEATLDFIKFLARRITRLRCFFLLTYRDDEIHSSHPLRHVLGQLAPDSFTRLPLKPLSRLAVEKMAEQKGYSGEDVYSISGGNPFYVNEILASYSLGVPDNIKDSVLSTFNRQDGKTRHVWEILSVLPTGLEIKYLEKVEPLYAEAVERCLAARILLLKDGLIFFKHELYRRTIELSLSPLLRLALNKKVLDLFLEAFEHNTETERIIHHAKNANEYYLVVHYAPIGARKAASVGSHIEACKLYLSAIEYYQGDNSDLLIEFYEAYAYECYLINQIKEAIIYTGKSLELWKTKNDREQIGNCMRFLSRLWWFAGNRKQAESFGSEAIEALGDQPSSKAKAMAFSNMSQLRMLSDQPEECIFWGEKAIAIAREINDDETLSHALNNVGSVTMRMESSRQEGIELLQQSLQIALKISHHEHVARHYTNLGCNAIEMKDYELGRQSLEEGIQYCDERDLDSWSSYMLSWKARLKLETGYWAEAYDIAENIMKNEDQSPIIKITALVVVATIKIRRGDQDALPLLKEARTMAFETMELQRIIPVLSALLEYEWITGNTYIETDTINQTIEMIRHSKKYLQKNEFAFWLYNSRKQLLPLKDVNDAYDFSSGKQSLKAAAFWERTGCPYEQALALFQASDDDKRNAIAIVQSLGAVAVYEKLKMEMRISGIKSIPRGIRKTTQSNPALLTDRELDVLQLLHEGMQNKEIAARLFISAKTVDHHISSILYKLEVNSRIKAVQEAAKLGIVK